MTEDEDAIDAVVKARVAFGGNRGRLKWALDFAQQDLDTVPPGQLADLCLQVTAFTSNIITGEVFSEETLRDAHKEFRRILGELVTKNCVTLGPYPRAHVVVGRTTRGSYRSLDLGTDLFTADQAADALGILLGDPDLPPVKACRAPKRWGAWGEVCGTWFAGRPNQKYCSALCQNRATTRATRIGAKGHTPKDEARALERIVNYLRNQLRGAQVDPVRDGLSPADARRIIVRLDRLKGRRGRSGLVLYVLDVSLAFLFRLDAVEFLDRQGEDRLGELLGVLREHRAARINGDGTIAAIDWPAGIPGEEPTRHRAIPRQQRASRLRKAPQPKSARRRAKAAHGPKPRAQ